MECSEQKQQMMMACSPKLIRSQLAQAKQMLLLYQKDYLGERHSKRMNLSLKRVGLQSSTVYLITKRMKIKKKQKLFLQQIISKIKIPKLSGKERMEEDYFLSMKMKMRIEHPLYLENNQISKEQTNKRIKLACLLFLKMMTKMMRISFQRQNLNKFSLQIFLASLIYHSLKYQQITSRKI